GFARGHEIGKVGAVVARQQRLLGDQRFGRLLDLGGVRGIGADAVDLQAGDIGGQHVVEHVDAAFVLFVEEGLPAGDRRVHAGLVVGQTGRAPDIGDRILVAGIVGYGLEGRADLAVGLDLRVVEYD